MPAGRKLHFKSPDQMVDAFNDYKDYCIENDRLMNIAGFCVYTKLDRTSYYDYCNRPRFARAVEYINCCLEDGGLNHKSDKMGMFYLKNKFGYAERMVQTNFTKSIEDVLDDLDEKDEGIDL